MTVRSSLSFFQLPDSLFQKRSVGRVPKAYQDQKYHANKRFAGNLWSRHLHLRQVQVYVPRESCGITRPPQLARNLKLSGGWSFFHSIDFADAQYLPGDLGAGKRLFNKGMRRSRSSF